MAGVSLKDVMLTVDNKNSLFTPASMLNELRRDLYNRIKIDRQQIELPDIFGKKQNTEKRRFVIKVDNLDYLKLLDLEKFAEIVYLINPQSDVKGLAKLPKNKVRIALPTVCRHPVLFADIIAKLLDGGYNKWEVANYWGFAVLPCERLDISIDSMIYMLNTQAMSMAAEMGLSLVTLSLEDDKINVCNIVEKSKINTQIVIYQDVPLFTSVGCIRDNDCSNCKRQPLWFDLERDGHKFKTLSDNCQMMVFDDKPYCVAEQAQDIATDYLRMDFIYRPYTPKKVKQTVDKLIQYKNVSDCIDANFMSNNL